MVIQDGVNCICNRHIDIVLLVYFVNCLDSIIPLHHLFHLQLCCLYRIGFAYHHTESSVTAELRIAGHQKVPQIRRIGGIPLLVSMSRIYKALHLTEGIGYQDRQEVVPVVESHTDTRCYGIDIFKCRGILHTVDICPGNCIYIIILEDCSL